MVREREVYVCGEKAQRRDVNVKKRPRDDQKEAPSYWREEERKGVWRCAYRVAKGTTSVCGGGDINKEAHQVPSCDFICTRKRRTKGNALDRS